MSEKDISEAEKYYKCIEIADEAMKSTERVLPVWHEDSLAVVLLDYFRNRPWNEDEVRDHAVKYLLNAGTIELTKEESMSVNEHNDDTRIFYYVQIYSGALIVHLILLLMFFFFVLNKTSSDWEIILTLIALFICMFIGSDNESKIKKYFEKRRDEKNN